MPPKRMKLSVFAVPSVSCIAAVAQKPAPLVVILLDGLRPDVVG